MILQITECRQKFENVFFIAVLVVVAVDGDCSETVVDHGVCFFV